MTLIIHHLKVALRNIMKFKLQTLISVLSIAIGIVTLAFTHSLLSRIKIPSICYESYYDRAYRVTFKSNDNDEDLNITKELIRSLKSNGGLRCAEKIAVPNGWKSGLPVEFHLADSAVRKGSVGVAYLDPQYPDYSGLRSSITGKKIKVLKAGEGIISDDFSKSYFQARNPIGAVQKLVSYGIQEIPITIVDVYDVSVSDYPFGSDTFYYCVADNIEDFEMGNHFFAKWVNVVLKEDCTKQQLLNEIDARVKPFGIKGELSKVADDSDVSMIIWIQLLGYIIGSLILLAGIIGFLRIQIQLFRIRNRELALRIVNGASGMQLFTLLLTEILICVSLAIIVSLLFGDVLQDFCDSNMNLIIDGAGIRIHNLWQYSIVIGIFLIVLCSLIVWITLRYISGTKHGLSVSLRRRGNHLFRNVMLGFQIITSMIFVCGTFILMHGGDRILKACNVPDNDDFYRDCLYLEPVHATKRERLIEEIKRLPELGRMVMIGDGYILIKEVFENPEMQDKFLNRGSFNIYCTQDTSLISILGMEVEWFNDNRDRNESLLISERLYRRFNELGLLDNNMLTIMKGWEDEQALPVKGIIKKIPYDATGESLVAVSPTWNSSESPWLLVPKEGKGKALSLSVNKTIERLEPELINRMVFNYREKANQAPGFVEAVRTGGCILGCISLLICSMSIFSTIALDTRARRKEVAIRKVNGAKSQDIYRMFGRIYLVMTGISIIVTVPVCVLFNKVVESLLMELSPESTLSPFWPIVSGCFVVIALIFAIVYLQIHRVMRLDPAGIIAKE